MAAVSLAQCRGDNAEPLMAAIQGRYGRGVRRNTYGPRQAVGAGARAGLLKRLQGMMGMPQRDLETLIRSLCGLFSAVMLGRFGGVANSGLVASGDACMAALSCGALQFWSSRWS